MSNRPTHADEHSERELTRKNNVLGWSLLALAIVIGLGTAAVGLIFNAVSSY